MQLLLQKIRQITDMKYLFFCLLAGNMALFAMGQGWLGETRGDAGRNPGMMQQQLNADQLTVKPAGSQVRQ